MMIAPEKSYEVFFHVSFCTIIVRDNKNIPKSIKILHYNVPIWAVNRLPEPGPGCV